MRRGAGSTAGPSPRRAMSYGVLAGHTGMDATNLAGLYDLPLMDWARIEARLDAA